MLQGPESWIFNYYYYFLALLWSLLCLCFLLNLKFFFSRFRGEGMGRLLLLCVIIIAGTALRIGITPYTHHVYNDEYGHFGKAIQWSTPGKAAPVTRHMPGWSYLLSLAFFLFGTSAATGFALTAFLSVLSIPLVYCFVRGFSEDRTAPLWGALIAAFLPLHLRYSATMDTDPISFSFLCLALAALSFYIREPRGLTFSFMLASAVWSVYIRQENIIFLIIALSSVALIYFRSGSREASPGKAGLTTGFLLTLAAHLPFAIQNLMGLKNTIYGQYFLDRGVSVSMIERLLLNLGYFFRNTSHPLLFTVLAFIGAAALLIQKKKVYAVAASLIWCAGYFAVYLFIEGHFK